MPKTLLVAVFLASLAALAVADERQSNCPEAEAASEILDAYHQESRLSQHDKRILHLVYWTPSDREPADQYRERLSRVMRHIQSFYREQMQQNGFGQRTFGLQNDADGLLKFHVVKGLAPFHDYGKQSGSRIRDECVPHLRAARVDPSRETILIFCNMGQWDETTRRMTHNSPYYAGGDNVSGTAWQLDEPIMDTRNLVDQKPMYDGQYGRISMGKHNSIFIGGVAHELGHALGLPHNQERPDQRSEFGTALMGSGNRTYGEELRGEGKGSFLTLAHAMRLASHPQFSGSSRGMSDDVRATIDNMKFTAINRGFRVTGTVSSEMPIYAVIAYTDPEGGGDYNATTQVAVPDENGTFSMDCTALVDGKPGELRLVTCHVNGKTTNHAFGYSVNRDGVVDLSEIEKRLALGRLVERLNAKDQGSARDLAKKLPSDVAAIAKRLIASTRDRNELLRPDSIDASIKAIPLSDAAATESVVGWLQPTFDRLPEDAMLLSSGGITFEHGIYSHAPAKHVYDLGEKWRRFAGQAGMADGHPGSVVFVIRCDGHEKWRSKTIKLGTPESFDLDLSDVQQLELVVENSGDGNGADWGVWLEPVLYR